MQKDRLAEFLERYHMGAQAAATSRELECVFSVTGKQLRETINHLRRNGVPIASNGSGYYYAATEQEVRATIAHLTRRIGGIAAAIQGLTRSLERFDTAQTRLYQVSTQSPAQAGLRGKGGARELSDAAPTGGAERCGLCDDVGGDGL